jgi:hypothetical protein
MPSPAQTQQPKQAFSTAAVVVLSIIIGGLGLFMIFAVAQMLGGGSGVIGKSKVLDIDIKASMLEIHVINTGTNNINGFTVYVNKNYKYVYNNLLRVGDTAKLQLVLFADGEKRFQPSAEKVKSVFVGGNGYDYRGGEFE